MLAKKLFSIPILLCCLISFGQEFTLTGKVTNTENQPLEYATISIQEVETFMEIAGTVTDAAGNFTIESPAGNYILYIESFTGNTYEQPIEVTQNKNLGSFKMAENSVVSLEGATITGSNPIYKMELDKKVYDLSQDQMAKGSSVSDALQNVPSVQVDGEGNVSLRGNEGVRILIDGKPSSLVGISDPATALQSLPADVVERIEVVTNPSARFEAEGSAGIINIILKKGKLQGFNGSININGGIPTTVGASANLNYRTGKWNLFSNLSYRYAERDREGSSYTTRFDSLGVPRYEDMNRESTRINDGYNIMLGTEYYLDDRNTFTVSGNYRYGKNENQSDLHYADYDENLFNVANSLRTEREKEDDYSAEGNFNYKHEFLDPGHEFTIDARGTYSEETEIGDLRETGNAVNSTERSFSSEYQNRFIISADYVYPFGEKGRLEIGARGESEGTLTDFSVDSLSTDGWVSKPEFANRTDYRQNVYAAYAQYGQGFGQFSFFAGLRMENSDITVKSILNENTTRKNYVDFFPSLFLNYEFENDNQLQISYSRRIRRPRGWDLIPFTSYSNNRNLFMGNPDLDPQYTDSYELSYVAKIGKLMITPNVYYSNTQDNIQRYQAINATGAIVTRPINVGTESRYGGELTFTYKPVKWWNMMGNVNLFGYKTEGEYTDTYINQSGASVSTTTNFDGEGFSWFGRLNNVFTLPAKFSVQLSGNYRAGMKSAQSERKPMYSADLSVNKDFWNDNATLSLSVRDLFNSRAFEIESFGDDFYMESRNRWNVRSINLTFTYRFNQSKKDQRREQGEVSGDFEMQGGE
ncbi:TonB-dependent receptor domain-containing protein [Moheibacter lacus]|uniref:TonB-dependent receptor n=1 Tax=Moheibacter lacus TaxID=2745851 RepID=A0A838ZPU2_9FLAO|nr:TonB-dependent receptor [Moheibacter lacus]MBA5629577.1 TonB-dependent receptor [Moheibacter lacus]